MTKQEILAPYYKQNKGGLNEWIDYSDALKSMDEWARQQAIAFFKFCLPGPTDFEPYISKRYSQFIEQQNKTNVE